MFILPRRQTQTQSESGWPLVDALEFMDLNTAREVTRAETGARRWPPRIPPAQDARRTGAGSPRPPASNSGGGRMQSNDCNSGPDSVAVELQPLEFRHNRLLAAIPRADLCPLELDMRGAYVEAGTSLFEMGSAPTEVYFPVTAVISLSHVTASGQASTIGIVGGEGMAGIDRVMGAHRSAYRAVVSQPGRVITLKTRTVAGQMGVSAEMRKILLGYALTCYTEASRTVVCVQRHNLEQRFCSRLLLLSERSRSHELWVSQEHLGEMLGVRRESITEVAGRMRRLGFIDYARGLLVVLNQSALSALACDCHASSRRGAIAATDVSKVPPGRASSSSAGVGHHAAHEAVAPA